MGRELPEEHTDPLTRGLPFPILGGKKLYLRRAFPSDVNRLTFREEDIAECRAGSGVEAPDVVAHAIGEMDIHAKGFVWTICERATGRPVFFLGVNRAEPFAPAVWLLGSPLCNKHAREILRTSPAILQLLWKRWPLMHNSVWSQNHLHAVWLTRLGAVFSAPVTNPRTGETFLPFVLRKEDSDV